MKRLSLVLILSALILLSQYNQVNASLLTINKDGKLTWNVLSETSSILEIPKHSYIEVKEVVDSKEDTSSTVFLEKGENGKINLLVSSQNEERQLDVTGYKNELVEIEERAPAQKLVLGIEKDKIFLSQKNVKAKTDFAMSVDAKTAEIVVKTPSGNKYVSILPYDAYETVLRTGLINKVDMNELSLVEEERELLYKVSGEKVISLLNFYDYSIPVAASLSASTGEILSIEAPLWYKLVGFLLT